MLTCTGVKPTSTT